MYAKAVHNHEQVIMAFVWHSKHHFCLNYKSKLNSTQNSYKNYKKFMNSKGPRRPKTSPNIKFCFIKIAHQVTYRQWLWRATTAIYATTAFAKCRTNWLLKSLLFCYIRVTVLFQILLTPFFPSHEAPAHLQNPNVF